MARVTVFGAGAMGTAFAMHAARRELDTALWANPFDERVLDDPEASPPLRRLEGGGGGAQEAIERRDNDVGGAPTGSVLGDHANQMSAREDRCARHARPL